MIEMVPITPKDLGKVKLRLADERECVLGGMTALEALTDSTTKSWEAFRVDIFSRPIAYWGHRPSSFLSANGHAWMLSTAAIEDHKLFAAAASRKIVDALLTHYDSILVQVDPLYLTSLKWLEWLGFTTLRDDPPFILMQRTR